MVILILTMNIDDTTEITMGLSKDLNGDLSILWYLDKPFANGTRPVGYFYTFNPKTYDKIAKVKPFGLHWRTQHPLR